MRRLHDVGALLAARLRPGSTVVLHSGCAEPVLLARQLAVQAEALRGVRVLALMPMGQSPYGESGPAARLDVATFFPGKGLRTALDAGRVRALRHPLSAIPGLFERGEISVDVLLLQVSPLDGSGHVSLGVSLDYMRSVLAQRPLVVAEINPRMPQTCGDTRWPAEQIDWFVEGGEGPQQVPPAVPDEVDRQLARHVAALVRDGAVLQIGIGSLPDAVLGQLGHLKHLGLHTGIVTDAVRPLIETGVIDNSTKTFMPGVSVTTMAGGTQAFYDFLHRNAAVEFHPCSVTHGAQVLAGIDGLHAINSALQVDLSGQVNAETVNGRKVSLPGGLPDFAAGAARSRGGLSIVALRSSFGKPGARRTTSNIVARLEADTPVTVPAVDVDFIVTEYGMAPVRGVSPRERATGLVAVAHPDHRESLQEELAALAS